MDRRKEGILAGTLVVGSEILIGRTRDTNTVFLAEELLKRGIKLSRWLIIPDEKEVISRELKRFISDGYKIIVVSGGMGPTHDDITVESVAKGLDIPMRFHKGCYDRMVSKWRRRNQAIDIPETAKRGLDKMAYVPLDFDLIDNENGMVEGLMGSVDMGRVQVFILPGVPREYKGIISTRKFQDYLPFGKSSDTSIKEIIFNGNESSIADRLEVLQGQHPNVEIGSYPQGPGRVIIRVTGHEDEVDRTIVEVKGLIDMISVPGK